MPTPLPPPPSTQASAQVTVTISGTAAQLTFFTDVLGGNDAAAWAQIYSALTAAGISYVPGSLYIAGVPLPASAQQETDSWIGIPIGCSLARGTLRRRRCPCSLASAPHLRTSPLMRLRQQ